MVSDQSERIKELTQINDLHLIMTVELRKLEGTESRPKLADMKDSVQLEYDADVVILVHNDHQVKGDESPYVWRGQADGSTVHMPYIGARVEKNKITGRTGPFFYKLNSWNLRVSEALKAEVEACKARAKKHTQGDSRVGRAGPM